jgi:hypothetical protein
MKDSSYTTHTIQYTSAVSLQARHQHTVSSQAHHGDPNFPNSGDGIRHIHAMQSR